MPRDTSVNKIKDCLWFITGLSTLLNEKLDDKLQLVVAEPNKHSYDAKSHKNFFKMKYGTCSQTAYNSSFSSSSTKNLTYFKRTLSQR